jgi:hypothetical protein
MRFFVHFFVVTNFLLYFFLVQGFAKEGETGIHNTHIAAITKELQYFAYDPALLEKQFAPWRPLVFFDNHAPDGYPDSIMNTNQFVLNQEGFGGLIAANLSGKSKEYAVLIKGAEVSKFRLEDIFSANSVGVDQIDEVADSIYKKLKEIGVFEQLKKKSGMLYVVGHSQGCPGAQLLGTYIASRAINEKLLTLTGAIKSVIIRGFGGVGARKHLRSIRGPDGNPLQVPSPLLDWINSATYLLEEDPAQLYGEPYIGTVYFLRHPKNVDPEEWWADNPFLRDHPRSRYRFADYSFVAESHDHAQGKVGL